MSERKLAIIADPDPRYQTGIASLLQPDFKCILAGSLSQTWQQAQKHIQYTYLKQQPLLLILELDQPDGDGIQLIRYTMADPVLRSVLIACVTTRSSLRDKLAAFRAGADDYWIKPTLPQNFSSLMALLWTSGYTARAARSGGFPVRSNAVPSYYR